ncbi:MAG: ribbon-helix-helix domain-containing protein [Deltaproteobacteria bacterium]|nr:ribbon-helix-helix domain-containing protein [Deltaproteobacteria bacterium]
MARKKISTTVYITPEQNERLKLLHERTKVPVAVYIREGIDLVLDQHQDELPGQMSWRKISSISGTSVSSRTSITARARSPIGSSR